MAASIKYENDYIVGGSVHARLSKNFKVKEFSGRDGTIHVHRELVAGLQILRNRMGSGIDVINPTPPASMDRNVAGLSVVIKSGDKQALEKMARQLEAEGYFSTVKSLSA